MLHKSMTGHDIPKTGRAGLHRYALHRRNNVKFAEYCITVNLLSQRTKTERSEDKGSTTQL
jgi:hypothetical protein